MEEVLLVKTQKERNTILSNYVKARPIGSLDSEHQRIFKIIYRHFYVPDEDEVKFNIQDIQDIKIDVHPKYFSKCFRIMVNDEWYSTSIKRLSGDQKTAHNLLINAMQLAILPHIEEFRQKNPLNLKNIEHEIAFEVLFQDWRDGEKKKPVIEYDKEIETYKLKEPSLSTWIEYHKKYGKLKWKE